MPYTDYVRERLFEPLGLTRMSFEPEPPAAKGYLAQPYADGVWDAVDVETGAWASAGQLWGTVGDLCRWGAFLADPDEAVLAQTSAEEMRTVQVIADHERWLARLRARPRADAATASGSSPATAARCPASSRSSSSRRRRRSSRRR